MEGSGSRAGPANEILGPHLDASGQTDRPGRMTESTASAPDQADPLASSSLGIKASRKASLPDGGIATQSARSPASALLAETVLEFD
jgi:hypothetical protein